MAVPIIYKSQPQPALCIACHCENDKMLLHASTVVHQMKSSSSPQLWLSAECCSSSSLPSTPLISRLQWLIHFHLHLVSPVFCSSTHTDSWLSNCPYVLRVTCVDADPAVAITEDILNTCSPHTAGSHCLFCHPQLLLDTAWWSDPLIETWTANTKSALFVVRALAASCESCTQHSESIRVCMEMYAHVSVWECVGLACCYTLMERCMASIWKWVLAGWLGVSLRASKVLICAHLAPCHCLDWDLHHGTTRLRGLAAYTWPLEETKPYSLSTNQG